MADATSERRRDWWRRELFGSASSADAALESVRPTTETQSARPDPMDRIAMARAAMERLVRDRFGGDAELLKLVRNLAISSEEAVAILGESDKDPNAEQMASLETIVIFDGTRPSFLIKDNEIDFSSSFNTGDWDKTLNSDLADLTRFTRCIGRVELDGMHIGTAFLVTPTLAVTNRHVAQAIADFEAGAIVMKPGAPTVDFGREQATDFASFDVRRITSIAFAGAKAIDPRAIDHDKFDIAVLRLTPSALGGDLEERHLSIGGRFETLIDDQPTVGTIGYPAHPGGRVPASLMSDYEKVIDRLFDGAGGAKRFAPGQCSGFLPADQGKAHWTAEHDASTLGGNSGSPLWARTKEQQVGVAGLHYGGRWSGQRTNWVHVLSRTGQAEGYGGAGTFGDFCTKEGIRLALATS
jgi:Trypsin-like peptidase domain